MSKKLEAKIENKLYKSAPPWFWRYGAVVVFTSGFLMLNQIPVGTTISNLSNIYIEGKRAEIKHRGEYRKAVANQNIVIANLVKAGRARDVALTNVLEELAHLKETNVKLVENSHKPNGKH